MTNQNQPELYTLSAATTSQLARRLRQDYEAFLAPGERFDVGAQTDGKDASSLTVVLSKPDGSLRLTLEAALLTEDQPEHGNPLPEAGEQSLGLLLEFLRLQLYEFFRQDRSIRPETEWKVFLFDGVHIRFAGRLTSPELERQADAILARQKMN